MSSRVLGRIRNDECEYSYGRARGTKRPGGGKRRGIICAAGTRAEINDEERKIYGQGRDEAELRRNDRPWEQQREKDSAWRALIAASTITSDELSQFNNLEEAIALNRRRKRPREKVIYGGGYVRQKR